MTVKEVSDGHGVSHAEIVDDGKHDELIEGYNTGHEAARRGELISTTIYKMSKAFRDGYLLGYDAYKAEATRHHRRYGGEDNE